MMVSKSPRIGASRGETRQQPDHGDQSPWAPPCMLAEWGLAAPFAN